MEPNPGSRLLLEEAELAELRSGPDRNGCYQRLQSRCMEYVLDSRQPGELLSIEDGEDIVSDAVLEELEHIFEPRFGASEVSARLQSALDRVRARYLQQRRKLETTLSPAEQSDRRVAAIRCQEIAYILRGYIGQAIDALHDRHRNLLIEEYRLDRFGFEKQGAAVELASLDHPKAELFKARQRFFKELEILLISAETALDQDRNLIRQVHDLIKDRGFETVLASASRKPSDRGRE